MSLAPCMPGLYEVSAQVLMARFTQPFLWQQLSGFIALIDKSPTQTHAASAPSLLSVVALIGINCAAVLRSIWRRAYQLQPLP